MPDTRKPTEKPNPIELDIIRSFGWSIIETELILFERYVKLSSFRSLTTIKGFKKYLNEMVAKGYLTQETLHGQRAYRRLLLEEDLHETISPKFPLDEMRLVLGAREAKKKEQRFRKWLGSRSAPSS
ncbi:MAG: hypothetical protein ACFFFC_01580 [Candidatus Thorarchaeota archaeon]